MVKTVFETETFVGRKKCFKEAPEVVLLARASVGVGRGLCRLVVSGWSDVVVRSSVKLVCSRSLHDYFKFN